MDPISPILQMGVAAGAVAVCTSLFIWNTLTIRSVTASIDAVADVAKATAAHHADEMTRLTDMAASMQELVRANQAFVSTLSEQLAKLNANQQILAANQLNSTKSVDEVIRQLISVIRTQE